MTAIAQIEGIGEAQAAKLKAAGVSSVEALLEAGASPKGREELAAKTGLSEKNLLEWVNHADLFRINGIGSEFADLLEAAGVDSVPELAQRNPENLYAKLEELNGQKNLVRALPALSRVITFIEEAKTLPKVVTH